MLYVTFVQEKEEEQFPEGVDCVYGRDVIKEIVVRQITESGKQVEKKVMFSELISSLSEEAKMVVDILIETPLSIFRIKETHKYVTINDIRIYLHRIVGWNFFRINNAIEEVRQKIQEHLDF